MDKENKSNNEIESISTNLYEKRNYLEKQIQETKNKLQDVADKISGLQEKQTTTSRSFDVKGHNLKRLVIDIGIDKIVYGNEKGHSFKLSRGYQYGKAKYKVVVTQENLNNPKVRPKGILHKLDKFEIDGDLGEVQKIATPLKNLTLVTESMALKVDSMAGNKVQQIISSKVRETENENDAIKATIHVGGTVVEAVVGLNNYNKDRSKYKAFEKADRYEIKLIQDKYLAKNKLKRLEKAILQEDKKVSDKLQDNSIFMGDRVSKKSKRNTLLEMDEVKSIKKTKNNKHSIVKVEKIRELDKTQKTIDRLEIREEKFDKKLNKISTKRPTQKIYTLDVDTNKRVKCDEKFVLKRQKRDSLIYTTDSAMTAKIIGGISAKARSDSDDNSALQASEKLMSAVGKDLNYRRGKFHNRTQLLIDICDIKEHKLTVKSERNKLRLESARTRLEYSRNPAPQVKKSTIKNKQQAFQQKKNQARFFKTQQKRKIRQSVTNVLKKVTTGKSKLVVAAVSAVFMIVLLLPMGVAIPASSITSTMTAQIGTTAYPASNIDITLADEQWTAFATQLIGEMRNTPNIYINFDEYQYSYVNIAHSTFEIIAFLCAKSVASGKGMTFDEENVNLIRTIFQNQYWLEQYVEEEERIDTSTEVLVTDEDGHSYYINPTYTYYIVHADIKGKPFSEIVNAYLNDNEKKIYNAYMKSYGNHQMLENPFNFDWTTNVGTMYGYNTSPGIVDAGKHYGLDLIANSGTKVHSMITGTVIDINYTSTYMYSIAIDDGNGKIVRIGLCDNVKVVKGQAVSAGDVIAEVGDSNYPSDHIHIETMIDGWFINPVFITKFK